MNQVKRLQPRAARLILTPEHPQKIKIAESSQDIKEAQLVNLSETGLLIHMIDKGFSKNKTLMVEFQSPNNEPIACYAKVIRSVDTKSRSSTTVRIIEMALVFIKMDPRHQNYLKKALQNEFKAIANKHKWMAYKNRLLFIWWEYKKAIIFLGLALLLSFLIFIII